MIWSVLRIGFFVGLVLALAYGAGLLIDSETGVRIVVGKFELNLSPLMAVLGAIVLLIAVWLAMKVAGFLVAILRFLNGDETAMSRYFDRNRERRGFAALSDGLMALASGEGHLAMTKASRAERFLRKPELTNLLTAQAAEMIGDRRKAEATYKALLTDDRTRFVGVRGIMRQKLSDGDTDTALKLAEKAFELKPKHEEIQDTLLKLQAEKEDWTGARNTLAAKLKHGTMPRDVHRRRDAVLALSEAKDVMEEGQSIEAREAAIEANRLSPDLIPAAVMAAHSYIEQSRAKYAARVLKKAWEAQPHPDLAAAFAAIAPDETPQERIKRFAALTSVRRDHPETKMLMAELQLSAEDFPAARKALGELATEEPTARSIAIMAAIEQGEGADEHVTRAWLTKALTASRGPQWVCDNCQSVQGNWAPVCGNCQSFDTLTWREPKGAGVSMPSGADMLPLLVGTPAQAENAVVVAEDAEPVNDDAPAKETGSN